MRQSVALIRREYRGEPLNLDNLKQNPIDQFEIWFEEAVQTIKEDPNAMVLSTADEKNRPSARNVLLKEYGEKGFVFYTNYKSRKANHIEKNPAVALTFYWPELVRQIRIEGTAGKIPADESDRYFRKRPYASQITAWASIQSEPLDSRKELEEQFRLAEEKYAEGDVPRPPYWGGYRVEPELFEFWQGRINRLHDRFRYTRRDDGGWTVERLAP